MRQMINNTLINSAYPYLSTSNLADEMELVKFTPLPLSLEELAKLWSVFFQTQYTLSVAYQGTVVLIESEDAPRATLPVREPFIRVMSFRYPHIERVYPATGPDQLIHADSTLVIEGKQLRGDFTEVRLAGSDPLTPSDVSDTKITIPVTSVPAANIRAGVQGIQVVQSIALGKPLVPHKGFESNVAPLVLHPRIISQSAPNSTQVIVQTDVVVGKRQRVMLLLNKNTLVHPAAYSFTADPRPADMDTLTVAISGVEPGDYFVRVQVDGAESPLDLDPGPDPNNPTLGPIVKIP